MHCQTYNKNKKAIFPCGKNKGKTKNGEYFIRPNVITFLLCRCEASLIFQLFKQSLINIQSSITFQGQKRTETKSS